MKRIVFGMLTFVVILIGTIAYTALKGYGFDTLEGMLITHLVPPILSGIAAFTLFSRIHSNDKRFMAFLLASVVLMAVFVEFAFYNIDEMIR